MSSKDSILRFLGLAMRAGKIVSGFDLVSDALKRYRVQLLIISEDISENTMSKLLDVIEKSDLTVDAYRFATAFELGNAIGKPNRAVIAVCDTGFGDKLSKMLSDFVDSEEID